MNIPTPQKMMEDGVHFGHQTRHWHPKMAKFIYTKHSNLHIIDLFKTQEKLKEAADFLKSVASKGERIIFIGTKPQCKEAIEIEAKKCGALHVTERWFGGTLTNFKEIKSNRDKLVNYKSKLEKGEYNNLTKKERLLISREIEKLDINFGGLVGLNSMPGAVFVVDARREKTAVNEAAKKGVPVVALLDTNTNPENVDYIIPGNDDAIRSVALITRVISEAVLEGYKEFEKKSKEELVSVESTAEKHDKEVKKTRQGNAEKVKKNVAKEVKKSSAISSKKEPSKAKKVLKGKSSKKEGAKVTPSKKSDVKGKGTKQDLPAKPKKSIGKAKNETKKLIKKVP